MCVLIGLVFRLLGLSQKKIIDFFRIQRCEKDGIKEKCRSLQGDFFLFFYLIVSIVLLILFRVCFCDFSIFFYWCFWLIVIELVSGFAWNKVLLEIKNYLGLNVLIIILIIIKNEYSFGDIGVCSSMYSLLQSSGGG